MKPRTGSMTETKGRTQMLRSFCYKLDDRVRADSYSTSLNLRRGKLCRSEVRACHNEALAKSARSRLGSQLSLGGRRKEARPLLGGGRAVRVPGQFSLSSYFASAKKRTEPPAALIERSSRKLCTRSDRFQSGREEHVVSLRPRVGSRSFSFSFHAR